MAGSRLKGITIEIDGNVTPLQKALKEVDGNMDKAVEFLREKGLAIAAKKAGRIASEGMVYAYLADDKKVGTLVEVNSETDFVAKNDEFRAFANDVAKQVAVKNPKDVEELLANLNK